MFHRYKCSFMQILQKIHSWMESIIYDMICLYQLSAHWEDLWKNEYKIKEIFNSDSDTDFCSHRLYPDCFCRRQSSGAGGPAFSGTGKFRFCQRRHIHTARQFFTCGGVFTGGRIVTAGWIPARRIQPSGNFLRKKQLGKAENFFKQTAGCQ